MSHYTVGRVILLSWTGRFIHSRTGIWYITIRTVTIRATCETRLAYTIRDVSLSRVRLEYSGCELADLARLCYAMSVAQIVGFVSKVRKLEVGGDCLNRKGGIVVVAVLLSTFVGGAFASQNIPGIQQVFVTNFPSNQHVTVTNPNLNVTVTNPGTTSGAAQRTVDVVDNLNITLPPCSTCDLARDGTLVAISATNSSLGFRQATIYVHWASISPGFANSGLWLIANQKPSAGFPGSACNLQIGCLQNIPNAQTQGGQGNFSMTVNVVGEQFVLYMISGSTVNQQFTNISISLFLSN